MEYYRTEITLDLNGRPEDQLVTAKQGDQFTRIIRANIVADGIPVTQTGQITAIFTCHKPDGTQVVQTATIGQGGKDVSVTLSEQCFTAAGACLCEFTFKQDEYILSTAVFTMMVYPSAYDPGALESTDDYQGFLEAIEEANNAAGAANTAAESANTAAGEAEDAADAATNAASAANTAAGAANTAGSAANSAASAANSAADAANSAADYAEEQGDYAKAQGDYAKGVAREARCLIPIPYGDNIPTEDRTAGVFYLQQTEEEGIPGAKFPVETDGTVTRPAAAPLQSAKILGKTTETGAGDKSPQNPYTISGATPVKIITSGRNILPPQLNATSDKGITATVEEDGSVTLNGTATGSGSSYISFQNIYLNQGLTYTLSVSEPLPTGLTLYMKLGDGSDRNIIQIAGEQTSGTATADITTPGRVFFGIPKGTTLNNLQVKVMLELGEKASAYEPYHGEEVSLPSLSPLYSLPDGTADSYDAVSGKEVRHTKCITFDGTEDWWRSGTGVSGKYRFGVSLSNIKLPASGDEKGSVTCSHYPTVTSGTAGIWGAHQGVSIDNSAKAMTFYDESLSESTLADFKAFLSAQYQNGTPVTVVYELSEPEETARTPKEIQMTEDTGTIRTNAGKLRAVYLQIPEGEAYRTQLQDADGNILCPATDAESVLGLSKVAKTGKYSDLTGAPGEIPFETGSFSMSPMPGTCYYQRVGNFVFLSCASTSFNGSGNGAADGLPFRAVTAKCTLCPSSYNADFNGEIKVSGNTLYYNTHSSVAFSGSFTCLYQIEQE